jgi:hypothetical protein
MEEGVFGVFGFLFCVVDKNEGVKREWEEKREKAGRIWGERGELGEQERWGGKVKKLDKKKFKFL